MGCCQPKCRCENVLSAIVDTNTIDLTGDGAPATPLQADAIFAPNIAHPLTADLLTNGVSGGVNGFEAQPLGQWFAITGDLGPGSMPAIVADTVGTIDWGPRLEYQIVNVEPTRPVVFYENRAFNGVVGVLEPGAIVTVSYVLYFAAVNAAPATMAPFFADALWRLENTGAALQDFVVPRINHAQLIGTWSANTPVGDFEWRGIQMRIETTGFTGPSIVAGLFFGSGPGSLVQEVPV